MIAELGHFALIVALALAATPGRVRPHRRAHGRLALVSATRPGAVGQFVFVAGAFAALAYSFVANDFSIVNVASHSNSKLPPEYRFAASWGSHEGSMVLWTLMLAGWTLAVATFSRHLPERMAARVIGVLGLVSVGFLLFVLLTSNPSSASSRRPTMAAT
jgi:cytochrome c-type biogenesis protein CcmF